MFSSQSKNHEYGEHPAFFKSQALATLLLLFITSGTIAQDRNIADLLSTPRDDALANRSSFFDLTYTDIGRQTRDFESELQSPIDTSPYSLVTQTTPLTQSQADQVPNPPGTATSPSPLRPVPPAPTYDQNPAANSAATPATPTDTPPSRSQSALNSRRPVRLARAPNMFGDFFGGGPSLGFVQFIPEISEGQSESTVEGSIQSPLAFGGRRLKVSENYGLVPQHRIYFNYNHFKNASDSFIGEPGSFGYDRNRSSMEIWTLGVEKPFGPGSDWSFEFRLPLYGQSNSSVSGSTSGAPDAQAVSSQVGNLSLVLKHVFFRNETTVLSGGLGLSVPTGDDVSIRTFHVTTELKNQSVDVTPWLGISVSPSDRWFHQFYTQVNAPLNGNEVNYSVGDDPYDYHSSPYETGTLGKYNLQSLFSVDLSSGYWLYRRPGGRGITGLAAVAELHYTTSVNDSDTIEAAAGSSDIDLRLMSLGNRQDILNMTLGLIANVNDRVTVRFGHVVPLRNGFDQPFTGETQLQVNVAF